MNIEPILLVAGSIGSISMIIWVGLLFTKTQKAKLIALIAFKIWAIAVLAIVTAVLLSGIAWRLHEHGSVPVIIWVLAFIGIGATLLAVKFFWDILKERK